VTYQLQCLTTSTKAGTAHNHHKDTTAGKQMTTIMAKDMGKTPGLSSLVRTGTMATSNKKRKCS